MLDRFIAIIAKLLIDIFRYVVKNFKLENLPSYKIGVELSSLVYSAVKNWDFLDKKTVGIQLIRSTDSIAANIAEGFGRFHKKDKIKFFYNARASVYESAHWVKTAFRRKLLSNQEYESLINLLRQLPKEINYLIKSTNANLTI